MQVAVVGTGLILPPILTGTVLILTQTSNKLELLSKQLETLTEFEDILYQQEPQAFGVPNKKVYINPIICKRNFISHKQLPRSSIHKSTFLNKKKRGIINEK